MVFVIKLKEVEKMTDFEMKIINFFNKISSSGLDAIFKIITMLGEPYIVIIILCFVFYGYDRRKGELLVFTLFSSLLINNFLKGIIARPRPFENENFTGEVSESVLESATGSSFPSGHSQIASVMYSSVAILEKKKIITIIAIILIFLVGLSRIYLLVHYPSDVIAGIVIGLIIAFLSCKYYMKIIDNFKLKFIVSSTILVLFFPLLFIFKETEKDFFTAYGLFLGYYLFLIIDNYFLKIENTSITKIKIFRFLLSLVFVGVPYFLLKIIFPENIYFDLLRYFIVAGFGFTLFPLLFKKLLFKTDSQC
jgi:membrane-associated phospholipid phosphatase